MFEQRRFIIATVLLLSIFAFASSNALAGGKEYEKVVKHLKTKYQAKKVKIPMIWLARFAVRMVRPAGVKSFSVTTFENLKFSPETLNAEMQSALKNSFSEDWSPIFRARSRTGQQAYMYMREAGSSIKVMVVTIEEAKATIIRAAFSPEKLVDFMDNPKVLGISLDDDKQEADNKAPENKEEAKTEAPRKEN